MSLDRLGLLQLLAGAVAGDTDASAAAAVKLADDCFRATSAPAPRNAGSSGTTAAVSAAAADVCPAGSAAPLRDGRLLHVLRLLLLQPLLAGESVAAGCFSSVLSDRPHTGKDTPSAPLAADTAAAPSSGTLSAGAGGDPGTPSVLVPAAAAAAAGPSAAARECRRNLKLLQVLRLLLLQELLALDSPCACPSAPKGNPGGSPASTSCVCTSACTAPSASGSPSTSSSCSTSALLPPKALCTSA
jgi:hypothetical protein